MEVLVLLEDETHVIAKHKQLPKKASRIYKKYEDSKGTFIKFRGFRVNKEEWKYGDF